MVQIFYRHIRSEKLKTLDSAKVGSWVNAVEPSDQELLELAETYGLDHSLLLDGVDLHESPRIENEDGATYIYTRFCYREGDHIHTSPMLIVYTKQHLITVLPKPFAGFAKLTHGRMPLVTTQKTKLLLQILAEVQNSYTINLNAISRNIFQIRSSLRQEEISNQDFISFIDIEETLNDFLSGLALTIIITIPTIISSIYGMNVTLPLMHKVYAFWFVVGVTAVAMIAAGWVFKRNKWF
jgi:magnesium transporter